MQLGDKDFRAVVLADFEFYAPDGERPRPICLVWHDLVSGRVMRLWEDELHRCTEPPYPIGSDALFVAYYASAEIACNQALGWKPPSNVLDLFVEFRNYTNGKALPSGAGLIGALTYFGLDSMDALEKEANRQLAIRGGPWSAEERTALLEYCESDVVALERLFLVIRPHLDVPRALLRGRYMVAAARMEFAGIPIDVSALQTLRQAWPVIQDDLVRSVDKAYHVFDGTVFKRDRWTQWVADHGIAWPRLASGQLAFDDDTFREMARVYPAVAPIRELRVSLSQMRLEDLAVGADDRNRCLLSAFRAKTGRNQPSNTKFIFGPSVWLRSLIRPEPGFSLAYVDWSQQEFGTAAALSGDSAMREAYVSGDPYLTFAKQAGAAPSDATKESHSSLREQFKACALAVQYGMGGESLSQRIGQPAAYARELLRWHRGLYKTFWQWSDRVVDYAMLHNRLFTAFGWTLHISSDSNPRSLRNFPMQANGSEMLRLACCLATEAGIKVVAPVHDALMVEAPTEQIDTAISATRQAMATASRYVLGGDFELRSEAAIVHHPERYRDQRGERMWNAVWDSIRQKSPDQRIETRSTVEEVGL